MSGLAESHSQSFSITKSSFENPFLANLPTLNLLERSSLSASEFEARLGSQWLQERAGAVAPTAATAVRHWLRGDRRSSTSGP